MSLDVDAIYDSAVRTALDGEGLLFIGAGFSVGATNAAGTSPKTGKALAAALAAAEDLPSDASLGAAADYYHRTRGGAALVALLKAEYDVRSVGREQVRVASVRWRRVYTTNFDDVF